MLGGYDRKLNFNTFNRDRFMSARLPLRIGLTGGIATGKSTVADYLAQTYHLPVLDADIYARDAVAIGSPILDAIAQRYGEAILQADGQLNRSKLGEIVFNHGLERKWLEGQIHPYVRDRLQQDWRSLDTQLAILAIPLLFEAQMLDLVDRVWVVYTTPSQQLERLLARDPHLSDSQAQARVESQMSLAEKIARADEVLNNTTTIALLLKQIDSAFKRLQSVEKSVKEA
jgi:dephospho-CoA kinase